MLLELENTCFRYFAKLTRLQNKAIKIVANCNLMQKFMIIF